jgi:hypothetical protein
MHYALWVKMHKLQPTKLVDSQILCIMSIMHYDLIRYEPVNCTFILPQMLSVISDLVINLQTSVNCLKLF